MAEDIARVREAAEGWLAQPSSNQEWPEAVLEGLRRNRQFDLLLRASEVAARLYPDVPKLRRLQAQALIEAGQLMTAIDVLRRARTTLPSGHAEEMELRGLCGRALKQVHVELGRVASPMAGDFLRQAIEEYEQAWRSPARPYWHGVNLLALRRRARLLGVVTGDAGEEAKLALEVFDGAPTLTRDGAPDHWGLATRFEASLVLAPDDAAGRLRDLVATDPPPFNVGSLLRQLAEVWLVPGHADGIEPFISALRAHHARLPAAEVPPISARDLATFQGMASFDATKLEAIFGPDGPNTMQWWVDGLAAAKSVCAVIGPDGRRIGTGFAVKANQLCERWDDRVVVLTNFHVCNREGVSPGLHVDDARIEFTATDGGPRHTVRTVRCESPQGELDYAVLELDPAPTVPPLEVPARLPVLPKPDEPQLRVFVIGHPDGRGLEFSVQNSFLVDIEDVVPGMTRRRLRYTTPTEKGSSGSPVFRSDKWAVIALHHAGGEMRQLNGKTGTQQANEGIAMLSIRADITARA